MQGSDTLAQMKDGFEKESLVHDLLARLEMRLEMSSLQGLSNQNRYKCPLCGMAIGCPHCGEIHQDKKSQRNHMMSHSMSELKDLQLALYMTQE